MVFSILLMQRKPIANKYRKGTMKSTLQARMLRIYFHIVIFILLFDYYSYSIHAPKGVKERVKLPYFKGNKKKLYI